MLAVKEHVRVSPIPGPSAVIAALSVSGLHTEQFAFFGFLSNKAGKRRKELKALSSETKTLVFYEAPHRIKDMLADVREIFGDRQVVMVREMTKVFEEVVRGTAEEILEQFSEESVRGEVTLVVAGRDEPPETRTIPEEVLGRIDGLLKEDKMSLRDIASRISAEEGSTFRLIYKECLSRKKLINEYKASDD